MGRSLHVLMVEDREADAALLIHELRRGGYEPTYERVDTPADMNAALDRQMWDLIIADHSMPQFSALGALMLLKERALDLPLIIVSGTIGEDLAVAMMKAGAHDYLVKDNLARLVPAVERELYEADRRRAHRRAEAALREAEAKYRTLVEQIPAIIYIAEFGAAKAWRYISPQIEPLLGFSPAAWLADPAYWHRQLHPDDRERVLAEESHSRASGEAFHSEYRLIARDGRVVWIRDEAVVVHDDAGQPLFLQGAILDISEHKRAEAERECLFEQVRAGRARLQALSRQLMEAQETERRQIARELHDEIGQSLTVAQLNLQFMRRLPQASTLASHLDDSMATIERVLQQVRALSLDLRPSVLDDLGLVAALRWYTNRQAERAGFSAQFSADELAARPPLSLEIACFRVAQEALTNIVRYARARHVSIELRQRGAELQLVIRDDGDGFDVRAARERATRGESLGLLGMQERVLQIGGRIEIESTPMQGTIICARFPLTTNPESEERIERRSSPR